MYENGDAALKRILELVDQVPEALREKAFEVLLQGYVTSEHTPPQQPVQASGVAQTPPPPAKDTLEPNIPTEVLTRLHAIAKRKNVPATKLAELFDFSTDPFVFAPLHVPGKGNSDRTRKVALLVAARSFLASSRWVADWAEIKAMCTHQACYDVANFSRVLNGAHGTSFKSVNGGVSVELSAQGITEAEDLLAALAGGSDAA